MDKIEAWLGKLEGEFKGDTDDRLFVEDWLPKLLSLVRLYRKCCEVTGALVDTNVEGKAREIVDG